MKKRRLALWLAIMVPVWALLGAMAAYDRGGSPWFGLFVGSLIGAFFGLVFGGNSDWKVWDSIFGPKKSGQEEE